MKTSKNKKALMRDFLMYMIIALVFIGVVLALYFLLGKGIETKIALFFKSCSPFGGLT